MRFIRVLFIVLTLPTMSFGQEKTIRYRIDYLMRQDAVTSLYKIEVVNKSDDTTIFLDMNKMRKKLLVITFLDVLAISVLDN